MRRVSGYTISTSELPTRTCCQVDVEFYFLDDSPLRHLFDDASVENKKTPAFVIEREGGCCWT